MKHSTDLIIAVSAASEELYNYCREQEWAGYDPYDALNSPLLRSIPLKWGRIAAIQFFRRFPLNLRVLFLIKKGRNPKAFALFIRALLRLTDLVEISDVRAELSKLSELLLTLQSEKYPNSGVLSWGYNFDWQSRVFYCEAFSPNLQSTVMGAHAFFELFESALFSSEDSLHFSDYCVGANKFILENLLLEENEEWAKLAYILSDDSVIFNVQAQSAWSLMRAYKLSGEDRFREMAKKLIRFVEMNQQLDGSWYYGEASSQRFIDSFHSGFILEALEECRALDENCVSPEIIRRGYEFYLEHFFKSGGRVSYFYDSSYPIDAHCIAQSIITLSKMSAYNERSEDILLKILSWSMSNFQSKKGLFYYQKWPLYTIKIPYMRWTQAWMLYALSVFLKTKKET